MDIFSLVVSAVGLMLAIWSLAYAYRSNNKTRQSQKELAEKTYQEIKEGDRQIKEYLKQVGSDQIDELRNERQYQHLLQQFNTQQEESQWFIRHRGNRDILLIYKGDRVLPVVRIYYTVSSQIISDASEFVVHNLPPRDSIEIPFPSSDLNQTEIRVKCLDKDGKFIDDAFLILDPEMSMLDYVSRRLRGNK